MKKRIKASDRELTPYEKSGMYRELGAEEQDGCTVTILTTYGGVEVHCRIPVHSADAEKKLCGDICGAFVRFACPGDDLTKTELMEVEL